MASFDDLAKQYARRIRQAIERDGFTSFRKPTRLEVSRSATVSEAKAVKKDIDSLVYANNNKPLDRQDKERLIIKIDEELGRPTRPLSETFINSASNDEFSDLADEIENILKGRN